MGDKARVLDYMIRHGSITPLEALNELGCYRLGARIWDLRQDGHMIDTTIEYGIDRHGEPARYARYKLREETA